MLHVYFIYIKANIVYEFVGSSSGNFVGSGGTSGGYGYGYSGGIPPGFPQQIFQQIPFDFNSLLAGYLEAFQKHHQTLMSKYVKEYLIH